jgi:serine/threonine-protein phosphatase 6 regulatory ankyrin repeat subunit B
LRGANVNFRDNDGATSLYVACQNGHIDVVKLLLTYKADPSPGAEGYNPLYIANQNGFDNIVEFLCMQAVHDINKINPNGSTAIYVASQNGHYKCVEIMLKYEASQHILYSSDYSCLYVACQNDHIEVVKILLNNDTSLMHRLTSKGASSLCVAIQKHNYNIVEYLCEKGVNVNQMHMHKFRPLEYAMNEGTREIVDCLVEYGAK